MADIVLTHGYFLWEDPNEAKVMKPYPPLGLLYLAAYARRAGLIPEVLDTTFMDRSEVLARLDATPGATMGIYTNLMTRANVVWLMGEARARDWTVIVGGPESANYPSEYLRHGAQAVVLGEGEETLVHLLEVLSRGNPHQLHEVAGVVFRDHRGRQITNDARPQLRDLDSLPWPERDAIDTQRYVDVWRTHHGMGSVNLITARGCPYKCNWCSHATYGHTHRRRSPADCAEEVAHIMDRYRPDQVWYADDVFTISHKWLFDYAAELAQRKLHVPFETISRADRMAKEEVFRTLADMGCYRIWIGSESGSQRILDAMQRGVTVEQVRWACRTAKRYGIEVGMFLMWGYEGEELSDIEATIDHVKEANPDIYFTTVSYPIKGTGYFNKVADKLAVQEDWASSTDRDLTIQGRHSRAYYGHADAWLHAEVDAHRLAETDPTASAERRRQAADSRRALLAAAHEVES
ncbi:MAG: B12-binding domain-containing radical SAM protein [Acidimicrobiales bacterium]